MSISSLFCPGGPPLEGRDADGMSGRSGRLLIPAEGGGPDFDEPETRRKVNKIQHYLITTLMTLSNSNTNGTF